MKLMHLVSASIQIHLNQVFAKKLKLDDQYKMDVYYNEGVIYIDYEGKPYCELQEIDMEEDK